MNNKITKKYSTVSVIIPTYNSVQTLKATILSCLNQTLPPLEILVCDDGSTDDSNSIITEINNPCVIWVQGEHTGGPGIPRNKGMALSKGEWLAFCDSDDEWHPTKLEKQILGIVGTKYIASSTNAIKKTNGVLKDSVVNSQKNSRISFFDLLKSNDIVCSSALIHRSLFEKIGGFSEIKEYGSFADFLYWLRITTLTDFNFINENLVTYKDDPSTSMRAVKITAEDIKFIALKDITTWVSKNKLYYFRYLILLHKLQEKVKSVLKNIFNHEKNS